MSSIETIAVKTARITPRQEIKDRCLPLKLLYDELTSAKEIPPLADIENKSDYWKEVIDLKEQRFK